LLWSNVIIDFRNCEKIILILKIVPNPYSFQIMAHP